MLTLVAILVLGLAYLGFENFRKSSIDMARDAMKEEIASMTREALNYYKRPRHLGGGGNSFLQFNEVRRKRIRPKSRKEPTGKIIWETQTAVYRVVIAAKDSVVIDGVGDNIGNDGSTPIKVRGIIKPNELYFLTLN